MTKRSKRQPRKQRLQELTVRKAKPGPRAYLIWDSYQSHLALQVQPTGTKSWKVIYSRHGRPRWLHLGPADSIGLSDARTMAAEAMLAVAKGGDPAADKRAERGAGTFAELHTDYLEHHAKKNNKSWRQADALVRRFALERWGKLLASSINREDIKTMKEKIQAPIVANQTLAAVSAIFTWAVKEQKLTVNPCKGIAHNATRSRERVLANSEVRRYWAGFEEADALAGAALKMVLLTGQRPGEVAQMRREHIVDGWWEMPGEPIAGIWPGTKNGQTHRVWLPKPAQALLAELNNNSGIGFVFAGRRGRPLMKLDTAMREISAKIGGSPVRPHDLRRTHGSTVTALGFGRDAMNRIQNHREGGIADVYDRHRYELENKQVMEAVAAKILTLAGRSEPKNVVQLR